MNMGVVEMQVGNFPEKEQLVDRAWSVELLSDFRLDPPLLSYTSYLL